MWCPNDAVALLRVFGRSDGINEITFALSDGSRRMVLEVGAGPTLLQRTWNILDNLMDVIKEPPGNEELHDAQVAARVVADILAMFMVPHFYTRKEISAEALRRWQARNAGDDSYETPGLGSRRYDPPPGSPIRGSMEQKETRKKSAFKSAPKAAARLTPEQEAGIKNALATGSFTVEALASMFKVPVSVVEQLKS